MREAAAKNSNRKKPSDGRPRPAEQIEKLILKLAKDNGWGYTRILGELRKLGIQSVARNTVKNILKRNGFDVGPKHGPGTWDEFLTRHAKTLSQCDFFSKKIVSKTYLARNLCLGIRACRDKNFQQISIGEVFVQRGGNQIDSWEVTLTSFCGRTPVSMFQAPHHQRKLILIIRFSSDIPKSFASHAIWYAYCFTRYDPTEGEVAV